MCDFGTCRPCRIEDRELNRSMGVVREYISPILPSREENYENRKVVGLPLRSSKKSAVALEEPPRVYLTPSERKKRLAETRKKEREEVDGRLVSINAPSHGSANIYTNWHCRCEPCSTAYSVVVRQH